MTTLSDNPVRRIMTDLAACLSNQIRDADNGVARPCTVTIVPGDSVLPEYQGECDDEVDPDYPDQAFDCGLAWVRLMNLYPASAPGVRADTAGTCVASTLGFDLNIGLTRCFELPEDPTTTLSPQQLADSTWAQLADGLIIRKAIMCCESLESDNSTLGTYSPIGPIGGLLGGSWSISVSLG